MDSRQVASLNALLDREIAAGEALVTALEAEREALTGTDADAVAATARAKEERALAFNAVEQERRSLLAILGIGAGNGAMGELIRRAEDPTYSDTAKRTGPLASRWRRVVDLISRCRADNERNGLIIAAHRRRVAQTINLLRTGRPDELTYGRRGAQAYAAGTRALGLA